jgi:hypothetical protein
VTKTYLASHLFLIVFTLSITGCAVTPPKITKIMESDYISGPKKLVLITGTRFDPGIRIALVKNGFKVKKFSVTSSIERSLNKNTKEQFNLAEARFGLSVYPGRVKDSCVGNDGLVLENTVFELSDLLTNDVLAYVEKSGSTQPCPMARVGIIWEELAKALADLWLPAK